MLLPQSYKNRGKILLLIDHLEGFMSNARLWPDSKQSFVAVSGGVDSMLLAYVLAIVWKKNEELGELVFIHLNHGTRSSNIKEEQLVRELASDLHVRCIIEKADLKLSINNFEKLARDRRYAFFKKVSRGHDSVYLAHHIDDSYEWSLMQQQRSGNLKSTLGIPLVNGNYKRPFHCLTKKQVRSLARAAEIKFLEDESNDNIRFDRNFIRHEIIDKLDKRYEGRLQHFVSRSNHLAELMNCSRLPQASDIPELVIDRFGGVNLLLLKGKGSFLGQENQLAGIIHQYFPGKRSRLKKGIHQIINSQHGGKSGSYNLGSGIIVYYYPGLIQLTDEKTRKNYINWDRQFSTPGSLRTVQLVDFRAGPGPYWVLSVKGKQSLLPGLKKPHPLFPELFRRVKKDNLCIRPYSQLLIKAQKDSFELCHDHYKSLI